MTVRFIWLIILVWVRLSVCIRICHLCLCDWIFLSICIYDLYQFIDPTIHQSFHPSSVLAFVCKLICGFAYSSFMCENISLLPPLSLTLCEYVCIWCKAINPSIHASIDQSTPIHSSIHLFIHKSIYRTVPSLSTCYWIIIMVSIDFILVSDVLPRHLFKED